MADPELATATGGYYSSTKLKKSSKQSRKPRLQDNVYEQTERTLRQHARPPAVAAIGRSPAPRLSSGRPQLSPLPAGGPTSPPASPPTPLHARWPMQPRHPHA